MSRLLDKMKTKRMTMVISLPEQTPEMAKIAEEYGADAIKTHANLSHRASGAKFASFSEEQELLKEILSTVAIPVGIIPGAEEKIEQSTLQEIKEMGFDFIDLYAHFMESSFLDIRGIAKIAACDNTYMPRDALALSRIVDGLEVSIVPKEEYGKPLSVMDLAKYSQWMNYLSGFPAIVPSQKLLLPSDIPKLYDVGVRCVMLGIISIGKSTQEVKHNMESFSREIYKL